MKNWSLRVSAWALLGLVGWGRISAGAAQPAMKFDVGTVAIAHTYFHTNLLTMGDKWRKAAGGKARVVVFPGTLGDEGDLVARMRVNQLQVGLLTAAGLHDLVPNVAALQNIPMAFRSWEEMDYVLGKMQGGLEKEFEDKGFVVLGWVYGGWVRFFSKTPAETPDDFRGLKIFAWSGGKEHIELMKAARYKPVELTAGDMYLGLENNLISAVPTIPQYAIALRVYKAAPNMLELNWVPLVGALVIRKDTWEKVPTEWREPFKKAAAEATKNVRDITRTKDGEAVATMKKDPKFKVHALKPEVEKQWKELATELEPKIRGNIVPAETFDRVKSLLAEFRASPVANKP